MTSSIDNQPNRSIFFLSANSCGGQNECDFYFPIFSLSLCLLSSFCLSASHIRTFFYRNQAHSVCKCVYMSFLLRLTVYLFGVSHYRPTERQMEMLYESNSGLHEPSRCDDISQALRVYFICKFYTFFIRFSFPTLVITFAYSRCCHTARAVL